MKRSTIFYTVIIVLVTVCISACQKDEEIGGTAVEKMAGEWWVEWDGLPGTYFHFSTYNTASNSPTEMWLDDNFSFWSSTGNEQLKGKVTVNMADLSFSGNNIANADLNMPITFTIQSGKIIPNGAKGPVSKSVTDSITFIAEFSDDPGTKYKLSGYHRTKFAEDDH